MKTLIRSLSLSLALAATALTQTPSDSAKIYFDVMKEGEFERLADLFSPEALKSFRDMMSFSNDLPDAEFAQFNGMLFGNDVTRESLKQMSNAEYFTGFMTFVMKQAGAAGGINFEKVEILGEVPEGQNVVHVLTRATISMGELEIVSMEVISFEKQGDKWMALLNGEMKGMAAQFKQLFAK